MNSTDACAPIIVNGTDHNVNDGGPCDTGTDSASCVQVRQQKSNSLLFTNIIPFITLFTKVYFGPFGAAEIKKCAAQVEIVETTTVKVLK